MPKNNLEADIFNLLDKSEMRFETKSSIYNAVFNNKNFWGIYNEISKLDSNHNLLLAIIEILKSNIDDTSYLVDNTK